MNETVKDYRRWDVPHPIPYQGSKRNLAPLILSYFPSHAARLVEPFAGSAAVSLAVAYRGMADAFLINDAHVPIADLWGEIIEHPEDLAAKYRRLWQAQLGREREHYDIVREKSNRTHKAEYFLYLLARCAKAAIRYNGNGESNNSPDNRRKGARPEAMRERILGASSLLHGHTAVCACDYREVLAQCGPSDLVYMDPPYQGVCKNRDSRYCPKVNHGGFLRRSDRTGGEGVHVCGELRWADRFEDLWRAPTQTSEPCSHRGSRGAVNSSDPARQGSRHVRVALPICGSGRSDFALPGAETREYDRLLRMAKQARKPLPESLKEVLRRYL